jgi:predicted RNA binding protein YcfA (HicA-like mRNA interferase family)
MAFHAAQWLPLFRPRPPMPDVSQMHGIDYRAAIAALEDAGFWVVREGVHVVMTNGTRVLTVPCNDPIHPYTLEGLVRDAGMTSEQFRKLL